MRWWHNCTPEERYWGGCLLYFGTVALLATLATVLS